MTTISVRLKEIIKSLDYMSFSDGHACAQNYSIGLSGGRLIL